MARSIADEKKKEDPLVIGGIFIGLVLAIILVMWFFRGAAVTKATLNPLLSMSKVWLWVGMDFQYQSAFNSAVTLSQELIGKSRPSIVEWINLVNVAFMPWFLLLAIPLLYITVQISRKKDIFMRRFTAKKLMLVNAEHFTGTLPVIAIRNDIVTDRNPLWRRQVTPEEVFLNYKSPTTRKPLRCSSWAMPREPSPPTVTRASTLASAKRCSNSSERSTSTMRPSLWRCGK